MNAANKVSLTYEQKGQRILLLALILLILISPFVSQHPGMSWLGSITLMIVLLAAAYAVSGRGRGFRVTLLLGVPALLSQLAEFNADNFWLETLRYSATPLFLFWVCILLLKDIALRIRTVTLELIMGSVSIYLLLGIGFALVFASIEHLQPGSFAGLEDIAVTGDRIPTFLYYSFVTITTLGYGDISPVMPYSMTASYLLAILGQLYLAILVASLVAMYIGKPGNKSH